RLKVLVSCIKRAVRTRGTGLVLDRARAPPLGKTAGAERKSPQIRRDGHRCTAPVVSRPIGEYNRPCAARVAIASAPAGARGRPPYWPKGRRWTTWEHDLRGWRRDRVRR